MKVKHIKASITACSAIMLLGLGMLSFEPAAPGTSTEIGVIRPSSSPAVTAPGEPNPSTNPTSKPEPTPTPTSTPTPTPTPTPSLAQINAALPLTQLTEETDAGLYRAVSDYLNQVTSGEDAGIKEINDIAFYYKDGISYDSIIYARYDALHKNSNVPVPALDVFFATMTEEGYTITAETEDPEVLKALYLSRGEGDVLQLYIKEVLHRYMNAKLACDESLLSELVTDIKYIDIADIQTKTQYIEEYLNLDYLIRACDDPEVEEFDYIVYVANDVKIININTPAPGLDEHVIQLDEENYPKIFFGITSEAADNFRIASRQQADYQAMLEDVISRLSDAMMKDSDLLEFIERINHATE